MEPILIAIAGSSQGTVLTLTDDELSIGREPSNRLPLNDPSVSRRHCLIEKEAGRFKLRDLASANGTFVNGVPVKERWLEHDDRIAVGDSLFLLLLHEEKATPASSSVQLDD